MGNYVIWLRQTVIRASWISELYLSWHSMMKWLGSFNPLHAKRRWKACSRKRKTVQHLLSNLHLLCLKMQAILEILRRERKEERRFEKSFDKLLDPCWRIIISSIFSQSEKTSFAWDNGIDYWSRTQVSSGLATFRAALNFISQKRHW